MAEGSPPDPAATRPEIQVFLDEIKSHPDDDTPRLVLADWLQEHGDPQEAARGEMLRIQLLLHQLHPSDPRREALRRRQGELKLKHFDLWVGPLADHVTWRFERGFLHLTARAPRFFRREVEALATPEVCNWCEALKVEDLRGPHVIALARSPLLPHVHTLDLGDNSLRGYHLEAVLRSPNLSRLRTLLLDGNRVASAGLRWLALSPHLAGLATLDLSRNRIDDAGAHLLAQAPHLKDLAALWVGGNRIGGGGREALRQRFGQRVHFEGRSRPESP